MNMAEFGARSTRAHNGSYAGCGAAHFREEHVITGRFCGMVRQYAVSDCGVS